MGDLEASGHYIWTLTGLKGGESDLAFFQASLPNGTIDVGNTKVWGQDGKPVPIQGGGHQVTWSPINLTRYIDKSTAMWDWFASVIEKGAVQDTKDNPILTCHGADGSPLFKWNITGAVATGYSQSEANAQSQGLMTETITLTYEEAKLER
jgi:phage tail-like protein